MAPCPRCARENPPTAVRCGRCGTPLALLEDPAPARLDLELDLDRRGRPSAAGGEIAPRTPRPVPGPAFDPDRSDWRLGDPGEEASPEPGAPPEGSDPDPGPRSAPPAPTLQPAPPVRRAAAWAVDGALLALAAAGLPGGLLASTGAFRGAGSIAAAIAGGLPIVLPSLAFVLVAALVYATVAHALAGATLGKRLAGIRVVGPDGRPPDPATSARRSAWALLSLALGGAGLLPALVTPSRRALHDLLAGTRVVIAG